MSKLRNGTDDYQDFGDFLLKTEQIKYLKKRRKAEYEKLFDSLSHLEESTPNKRNSSLIFMSYNVDKLFGKETIIERAQRIAARHKRLKSSDSHSEPSCESKSLEDALGPLEEYKAIDAAFTVKNEPTEPECSLKENESNHPSQPASHDSHNQNESLLMKYLLEDNVEVKKCKVTLKNVTEKQKVINYEKPVEILTRCDEIRADSALKSYLLHGQEEKDETKEVIDITEDSSDSAEQQIRLTPKKRAYLFVEEKATEREPAEAVPAMSNDDPDGEASLRRFLSDTRLEIRALQKQETKTKGTGRDLKKKRKSEHEKLIDSLSVLEKFHAESALKRQAKPRFENV